jgi:hypothetical protein
MAALSELARETRQEPATHLPRRPIPDLALFGFGGPRGRELAGYRKRRRDG